MSWESTTHSDPLVIIVVHADATTRNRIAAFFHQHTEWLIQEVPNGGEAVRSAMSLSPQLVLLDPYLQGMNGAATIAALRAHGISCPIMALVEHSDNTRNRWEAQGYVDALELSDELPHWMPKLQSVLLHF